MRPLGSVLVALSLFHIVVDQIRSAVINNATVLQFDIDKTTHLTHRFALLPKKARAFQVDILGHNLDCLRHESPLALHLVASARVGLIVVPLVGESHKNVLLAKGGSTYCAWAINDGFPFTLMTKFPGLEMPTNPPVGFIVYAFSWPLQLDSQDHPIQVAIDYQLNSTMCAPALRHGAAGSTAGITPSNSTIPLGVGEEAYTDFVVQSPFRGEQIVDQSVTSQQQLLSSGSNSSLLPLSEPQPEPRNLTGAELLLPGCGLFQHGTTLEIVNNLLASRVPYKPVAYRVTAHEAKELDGNAAPSDAALRGEELVVKQMRLVSGNSGHTELSKGSAMAFVPQTAEKDVMKISGSVDRVVLLDVVMPPPLSSWFPTIKDTQTLEQYATELLPHMHGTLRITFPHIPAASVTPYVLWSPVRNLIWNDLASLPVLLAFQRGIPTPTAVSTSPLALTTELVPDVLLSLPSSESKTTYNSTTVSHVNFLADYRCSVVLFTRPNCTPWTSSFELSFERSDVPPFLPSLTFTKDGDSPVKTQSSIRAVMHAVLHILSTMVLTMAAVIIMLCTLLIFGYIVSPGLVIDILAESTRVTSLLEPCRFFSWFTTGSYTSRRGGTYSDDEQMELANWMLSENGQQGDVMQTESNFNLDVSDPTFLRDRDRFLGDGTESDIPKSTTATVDGDNDRTAQDWDDNKFNLYEALPDDLHPVDNANRRQT